jgi:hypothetical protein
MQCEEGEAMRRQEHCLDRVVKWGWLVSGIVHVIFTLTMARTLAPAPGRPAGEQLLELTFNYQQDELEALEQDDATEFDLVEGRTDIASIEQMLDGDGEDEERDKADSDALIEPLFSGAPEPQFPDHGTQMSIARRRELPEEVLLLTKIDGAENEDDPFDLRSGPPADQPGTKAEFFGTVAHGDRFVYILDKSGSMGTGDANGSRLEAAMKELRTSVGKLTEDQKFCVMVFSDTFQCMNEDGGNRPQMRPANSKNKRALAKWLATIKPAGGTEPRGALRAGLALNPSGLFLLSDGEFNGGPAPVIQGLPMEQNLSAAEVIERYNSCSAPVHTIAFIDKSSQQRMEKLAMLTGGEHRFIGSVLPQPAPPPQAPPQPPPRPTLPPQRKLLAMAYSLESHGKYTAAVRRYREILQKYPRTAEATFAMRRIYVLDPP